MLNRPDIQPNTSTITLIRMLHDLPSEVLGQVVLHLCTRKLDHSPEPRYYYPGTYPPDNWVVPPVALLCTCRAINSAISPSANPELYAQIYRANFDTAAVYRRLGDAASSSRKVRAKALTAELKRRVIALRRLTRRLRSDDVSETKDDDLWFIYLMLIENGKYIHISNRFDRKLNR